MTGGAVRSPLQPGAGIALLGVSLVVLYAPLLPELVRDWSGSGDFAHGFVVAPVAAWLLWRRRAALAAVPAEPSPAGALLLGFGVLQFLLGIAASEFWLQRASLVPVACGWTWLQWGGRRLRIAAFPIAFLLFLVPPPALVWNGLSVPLQLVASRAAGGILDLAGVAHAREGNVLHLGACSLEVAHACSGLRSLVALLAVATLVAEGSVTGDGPPRGRFARATIVLAAIPAAIGANALRVGGTALAVARTGEGAATGLVHEAFGALGFLVALGALFAVRGGWAWVESRRSA